MKEGTMPLSYPDWPELSWYVYLAVGSAVAILLALGMHYAPVTQKKIPTVVLGIVGGLGLGATLALIYMMGFGWRHYAQHYEQEHDGPPPGAPAPQANGGGPRGGGGAPGMGGQRGGGRGGRRANPKADLASLVAKLDLMTHERPTLKLDAEQKRKILEQLKTVDKVDALLENEAKDAIVGIQKILKDQRKTLEDIGYHWTEEGEEEKPPPLNPPNPFKTEPGRDHLQALRNQLEKNPQ
jgi:hypothetical protein